MSELLFPRVVEADDDDFSAQRELAHWQFNEAEHRLHNEELDLVEMAYVVEYLNEAQFAIRSLNKAGISRGVLSHQLKEAA